MFSHLGCIRDSTRKKVFDFWLIFSASAHIVELAVCLEAFAKAQLRRSTGWERERRKRRCCWRKNRRNWIVCIKGRVHSRWLGKIRFTFMVVDSKSALGALTVALYSSFNKCDFFPSLWRLWFEIYTRRYYISIAIVNEHLSCEK